MTTSRFQQSDYKSNVDQTDGHLHVSSGSLDIKVKEQSDDLIQLRVATEEILKEIKLTNKYLAEFLGDKFSEEEK